MSKEYEDDINVSEIMEVVSLLNHHLYDELDKDKNIDIGYWMNNLSYKLISDGDSHSIKYLGIVIWDSDNDERPYFLDRVSNEERHTSLCAYILEETKIINSYIKS